MKKLAYVFAALATIAVAAPTVASAEEFSVRVGGDRDMYRDRGDFRGHREFRGARAEFYGDRGLHRGWYNHDRDRVVVAVGSAGGVVAQACPEAGQLVVGQAVRLQPGDRAAVEGWREGIPRF